MTDIIMYLIIGYICGTVISNSIRNNNNNNEEIVRVRKNELEETMKEFHKIKEELSTYKEKAIKQEENNEK